MIFGQAVADLLGQLARSEDEGEPAEDDEAK